MKPIIALRSSLTSRLTMGKRDLVPEPIFLASDGVSGDISLMLSSRASIQDDTVAEIRLVGRRLRVRRSGVAGLTENRCQVIVASR